MGFYYRQEYCTGCKTCQIACKDINDLPVGTLFRRVRSFETGKFPKPGRFHYAQTCNHCSSPACIVACPTGALYIDEEDETVQQDRYLCIGCKRCVDYCPYGVPQFLESKGIADKCDACIRLRAIGEPPVCVAACPMRALEFGKTEELRAKHLGENLVSDFPFLPDSSKTLPSTLVKGRNCAFDPDYREHLLV